MVGRCRMALVQTEPLHDVDDIEVRAHATPLYVFVFFIDHVVYANHHILGRPASDSPVIEVPRDTAPELWASYDESLESIWNGVAPVSYPLGPLRREQNDGAHRGP